MMQKQVNKDSSTNQEATTKKIETCRSHDRKDDHGGSRKSRSASRNQHRHSPENSSIRAYSHSRSKIFPSISPIRNQRMRHLSNTYQGGLRKIKPPSLWRKQKRRRCIRMVVGNEEIFLVT